MYTRKGDNGKTFLFSGRRVYKDNPRVEAYGSLDELNSWLGLIVSLSDDETIKKIVREIQDMVFVACSDLADEGSKNVPRISEKDVKRIEDLTDEIHAKLPRLTKFIVPGGTLTASVIHVARTVCRRAERRVVTLSKKERINEKVISFLNRLSTLLFNLARYANMVKGVSDQEWKH
jgi:cob(I)alamin adenosyltransferase